MRIITAHLPEQLPEVRTLFQEYAAEIQVDLCFQGFAQELAELPGDYAPPSGRLFLAREGTESVGCVGLRPFAGASRAPGGVCEMKRLYVRPAFRGRGIGRKLAQTDIDAARAIGYDRMCLDTLAHMTAAIALYRSLGFLPTSPYRHNPLAGAAYFALDLHTPSGGMV
jgi:putative acetyltransferase